MHEQLPAFLAFFKYSWVGELVRGVPWLFEWLEAFHFIGFALLIGVVGILDLRILGVARGIPVGPIHRLLPWAFVGFGINLITGIGFFCSEPESYAYIWVYKLKMALILLAGLNALWFRLAVYHEIEAWGEYVEATPLAKLICGLSLSLWVGVLVAGRFIAYFSSGTL